MSDIPNPGSDQAVALGCTCPIFDNGRGQGLPYRGERVFWMAPDCPIHQIHAGEPHP